MQAAIFDLSPRHTAKNPQTGNIELASPCPQRKACAAMKPVQFLMACLIATGVAVGHAQAQVARQTLTFVLSGQYQTNAIHPGAGYTNEHKFIKTVYFSTANIRKALALDHAGTDWTNLYDTDLVREIEFTNGLSGREGIFLYRSSPPTNVNVSSNFSLNFTNNFTQDVAGAFPGATNFGVNNTVSGGVFTRDSTNTNSLVSAGLFSISLYTTNLQFNLIGYGTTTETNLLASHDGVRYSGPVQRLQVLTGVGTFGLNVSTNFFENSIVGAPNTNFVSGPAHGYFGTAAPVFLTNSPAAVFGS